MRTRVTLPRVSLAAGGLIVLAALVAGCGDDGNGPTAPLVAPTPTAPVGLNGIWSGTVRYAGSPSFLCGLQESSVTANIRQNGSAISVSLSARCWNEAAVQATLSGDDLAGSAWLGDYCDPRTATGAHSGGVLRLQISHVPGEICHPGGSVELHR
jgi:hypothetical protein